MQKDSQIFSHKDQKLMEHLGDLVKKPRQPSLLKYLLIIGSDIHSQKSTIDIIPTKLVKQWQR